MIPCYLPHASRSNNSVIPKQIEAHLESNKRGNRKQFKIMAIQKN